MRRILVVLAALACSWSCKKSESQAQAEAAQRAAKQCEAMNELSLAYVAGLAELEVESLDDPAQRAKIQAVCKTMPPEVVDCANRLALDDARCDAALEKYLGMTDSEPQGKGPTPSWELAMPFDVFDIDVASDGRVAVAGDDRLALVAEGSIEWTVELEDFGSRVAWWKTDCIVVGSKGTLRCYDGAGQVAWSHSLTDRDVWLSAIEPGPAERLTVIDSKGSIVHVDGAQCAAKAEGCATPLGAVESLGGMQAVVLPSGAILGSDDDGVTLASASGARLAHRPASFEASTPGQGLIVAGHDVLRANPECTADADDCWQVVTSHEDLELVAPVEVPGVGVAFGDTYGVIHMNGGSGWKIDAGNDGDLVSDGTTIYSVGHVLGLGDALNEPPQVRAIDAATGKTRWITTLGTERAGLLSGYIVILRGQTLVVSTSKRLFSVPVGT